MDLPEQLAAAQEAERARGQRKTDDLTGSYRSPEATCENCGRVRVLESGVCEKCEWDNDAHDYAIVTREYWQD